MEEEHTADQFGLAMFINEKHVKRIEELEIENCQLRREIGRLNEIMLEAGQKLDVAKFWLKQGQK